MSEIERQQLTWSRWQFVLTPLVTPREFNTVAMTPLHLDDLVFLLHGEVQAVHTLSLLAIVNGVLQPRWATNVWADTNDWGLGIQREHQWDLASHCHVAVAQGQDGIDG
jgi:hypothetical protein